MVTKIEPLGTTAIQPDNDVGAYNVLFQEITPGDIVSVEYVGSDLAPAVPREVLLGSLRDGRLRVNSPIKIKLMKEDKHIIAEAVDINEFGFGENPSEALADLQHAIAELYFTLEKEQERLGADLQRIWKVLQEKILKR